MAENFQEQGRYLNICREFSVEGNICKKGANSVAHIKKVTITDIAEKAQVSISTVSRALSGNPGVNEEIRRKVKDIASAMGYIPPVRKKDYGKAGKAIAFLVESSDVFVSGASFFGKFLAGVQQVFEKESYRVILSTTRTNTNPQKKISELIKSGVNGFILAQTQINDPFVKVLLELKYPFVTLGRPFSTLNTPYVDVDSFGGAYAATTALAKRGHRRIAYISGKLTTLASMARLEGYRKALQDFNIKYDERYTVEGGETQQEAYTATIKLLQQVEHPPTGIFVYNDFLAVGVISALHDRGFKIPEDVCLIGFDDEEASAFTVPPLASVRWPVIDMGKKAAEMLLKLLKGEPLTQRQFVLPVELVERESLGELVELKGNIS